MCYPILYLIIELLASIHRRIGPNVLSLLIPFNDGLKLILKAIILPLEANSLLFIIAPLLSFILAFTQWLFLLLEPSILLFLALSSLTLYALILAGWSANSKYALLGSLRSIAQMISYSIALSLLFLAFIFIANRIYGSLNYRPILFILILFIIALIIAVAETNRAPFDLPEAESELVAGFLTEHSALPFTLLYLAEYLNIFTISYLFALLFAIDLLIFIFILFWLRASIPRLKTNTTLLLGWIDLLPLLITMLLSIPPLLHSLSMDYDPIIIGSRASNLTLTLFSTSLWLLFR